MVSASHGLSSRPFAAPAQPHRPPRPAARAQARLAHLSRGWHRRRAPRCHRQRTRAAEAPLAGACGKTASVSARLPAAARRTGRPSSRAAPSEPSGRPHRSVGGSSVTTAGLSSHPHAAPGRPRGEAAPCATRCSFARRQCSGTSRASMNFYVSLSPSGSLVTQPQLLCSAHTSVEGERAGKDRWRAQKVIKRHATHSLVHTRHVCSGKSAQIAGSWDVAQSAPARQSTQVHPALRVLPLAARAAPRRDQPSLWPHPVQPARRVWPQRGPHPRAD